VTLHTLSPSRRARVAAGLAAALALLVQPAVPAYAQPSFVVFLADDMGFSDLGSYGGEVATPAIDRIGAAGVRFRHFYATPRCSPTRAALLTGRHPHAAGMGHLADFSTPDPAYLGAIRPDVPTLPELLAPAGYHSYMVGKWHLDASNDPSSPDAPRARGFDRFYGVMRGAEDYYRPRSLARDTEALPAPAGDFYLTDRLAEEAAALLREHEATTPERPFFLYVAFTAPHWPVQAPEDDVAAAAGLYEHGWDRAREERASRVRHLAVLPGPWTPASREPAVPAWPEAPYPDWQRARMRAYAGMLRAQDRAVATVLQAMRDAGRDDDTVVAFLSDNGASPEELGRASAWLRRAAGLFTWEYYGDDPSRAPGGPESFQSYGRAWSAVSNAPLRGHKAGLYEGGIASPLLLAWPGGLTPPPGAWLDAPAHVTDLAATILELAGASVPAQLDGESLVPLLRGRPRPRAPIPWEHEGWRAMRDGDQKAVAPPGERWQLYDLAADRTEQHDLAAERPGEVARLAALHDAWARQVGVRPWPWVLPIVRRAALGAAVVGLLLLLGGGYAWWRRRRAQPR
jgi:arylsulfatase